jgi:hypothetical protein
MADESSLSAFLQRNALAGDPGPDEVYGTEDVLRMMNARRGADDHEGRSALARLLTTMVPMSMLGIRSSRGVDMATGSLLNKRAESLGNYGDDILKPGVDWPNTLAYGYQYKMRPAAQPNPAMNYRSPVEMQTGQPRVPRWDNENPATLWPTELPTSGPGFNVPSGYGSLEAALTGPHGPAILARIRGRTADKARQGFKPIPGGKE